MLINGGGTFALAVLAGHVLLWVHGAAANDAIPDPSCSELESFACRWGTPYTTCRLRNWEHAGCQRKDYCEKEHGDMDAADCCRLRDLTPLNEPDHIGYMKYCAPGSSPGAPGLSEVECFKLEDFVCHDWMEHDYCRIRFGENVGCRTEKECTSSEYSLMCCQDKTSLFETPGVADRYMTKCHAPAPNGLVGHCERMATQADWCQKSFRDWVSLTELRVFARNRSPIVEWWKRMNMDHWIKAAKVPESYDDEPATEQGQRDLKMRKERAYAMTAREWRVMCARAVSEKKICEADPQRELRLMTTPDWMRRMALTLEEDVEAGKRLNDSAEQYAYGAGPADAGGVKNWTELELAATAAWRNRLLKLEELAVHRPPHEDFSKLNQRDPVWETWKSTALNMTPGLGGGQGQGP